MHKCDLCQKREWRLVLGVSAYDTSMREEIINRKIFACYHCASEFFGSLVKIIDRENSVDKKAKTVNSLLKRYRDKGKITKDELIDINLWIKKIKGIKDFQEDK